MAGRGSFLLRLGDGDDGGFFELAGESLFFAPSEVDYTRNGSVKSIVSAIPHAFSGAIMAAALPDNNFAGLHWLTTIYFYTEPLALRFAS